MRKQRMMIPVMVLALLLALAGCGKVENEMDKMESQMAQKEELTAAERTQLYQTAIEGARDAEMNESVPVITSPEDDLASAIFVLLDVTAEDMESFAIAVSPVNVKAYGIAAIKPADGREAAVLNGLQDFIAQQKSNFQQYLADQYAIAEKARLETLDNGTVLMVMCEDQDTVLEHIKTTIEAGT